MSEAAAQADIAADLRCASRLVAAVFDLPPDAIVGQRKGSPANVHARQVVCYLLHTDGDFNHASIGRALGRNRSTVTHAIEVVTSLLEHQDFERAVERLGQMFRDLREARANIPALVEEIAP